MKESDVEEFFDKDLEGELLNVIQKKDSDDDLLSQVSKHYGKAGIYSTLTLVSKNKEKYVSKKEIAKVIKTSVQNVSNWLNEMGDNTAFRTEGKGVRVYALANFNKKIMRAAIKCRKNQ